MSNFNTQDIVLATYLVVNGVTLIEIIPVSERFSAFIFEEPPQALIMKWLAGSPYEKSIVQTYRHLVKDSWEAQNREFPKGGGR